MSQPLELLYESVRRDTAKLTVISLADITSSYLQKLSELQEPDPHRLAAFIDLGARLVHLKSQALLPLPAADEADGLAELNSELQHYVLVRAQTNALRQRLGQRSRPRPSGLRRRSTTRSSGPISIDVQQLAIVWSSLQSRRPQPWGEAPHKPRLSMPAASAIVRQRIANQPITLAQLLTSDQPLAELIVVFLAVLELFKAGEILLTGPSNGSASQLEIARV